MVKKSIRKTKSKKQKNNYFTGKFRRARKTRRNKKSGKSRKTRSKKLRKTRSSKKTRGTRGNNKSRKIGGAPKEINKQLIDAGIKAQPTDLKCGQIHVLDFKGVLHPRGVDEDIDPRPSCGDFGCVVIVQQVNEPHGKFALKVQKVDKELTRELEFMEQLGILEGQWDHVQFNFSIQPLYNYSSLGEHGFGDPSLSTREDDKTKYAGLCLEFGKHTTFSIISTLAADLKRIHEKGIVHRDIKPDNIMLHVTRDHISGDHISAHLIDFGLALRDGESESPEMWNEFTPPFIVPYSLFPKHQYKYNFRGDIWSFACVCYILLANSNNIPRRWVEEISISTRQKVGGARDISNGQVDLSQFFQYFDETHKEVLGPRSYRGMAKDPGNLNHPETKFEHIRDSPGDHLPVECLLGGELNTQFREILDEIIKILCANGHVEPVEFYRECLHRISVLAREISAAAAPAAAPAAIPPPPASDGGDESGYDTAQEPEGPPAITADGGNDSDDGW
jgi:serine/threonine protein kinase